MFRLRSSRVCVLGMGGLGCEVVKNLVLSGIKELRMVDGRKVTEQDATSQFFAPRDEIGKNRAESSLNRVQQLNPMVEVTADPSNSETKDAEFFEGDTEPPAKKQKTTEMEMKSVRKEMAFVSLAETLKVDWSSEQYAKRVKRMDPSFFLLQVGVYELFV